jgi:two-component system, NarL family, response regulator DevR
MEAVRVMVVDDAADVRYLIGLVLEGAEGIEVVAEAEGAEQALAALEAARPDVILVDARMPAIDGFELTGMLLERRPDLRVAMLTSVVDAVVERQAREAGAHACFSKADIDGLGVQILGLVGR